MNLPSNATIEVSVPAQQGADAYKTEATMAELGLPAAAPSAPPAPPPLASVGVPGLVSPDGVTVEVTNGVLSAIPPAPVAPPAIPLGAVGTPGLLAPDGQTIKATNGVLTVPAPAPTSPPLAVVGTPGISAPDGVTIKISEGILSVPSAAQPAPPPIAAVGTPGLSSPDGTTIKVSASGVLTVPAPAAPTFSTMPVVTVAALPSVTAADVGWIAYATNGRNTGQAAGAGTGCLCNVNAAGVWTAAWSGSAVLA